MKIFLTGGTGFIGTHFLIAALAAKHNVVALRRKGSAPKLPLPLQPTWLETAMDRVQPSDLEGCDTLVHFASVGVSPQKASWDELMYWNVSTLIGLLQSAKKAGIKRAVLAGSFAEYGRAADCFDLIPPDAPLLPTYGYAASKAASFTSAHGFCIEQGMELSYLRIFSAFGDGQFEGNFWPALRQAALAGEDFEMTPGEQIRDYVSAKLVAEIFLSECQRADIKAEKPRVANVGSGHPVSMREFAEYWWMQWEAKGALKIGKLPYRANEVMRFVPLLN